MKIVIAGGGTAGHVNPAVALASRLRGDSVVFVGTSRGAEARLVPAAGFTLEIIEVAGFDRSRPGSLPATGAKAVGAVRTSRRLMKSLRPDVVVGMGGYVGLPVCLAARSAGIPVVIHEQNIVLGLANRVCRRIAERVAVSFEDTLRDVGRRGVFTGNPVRPELLDADLTSARSAGLARFGLDPDRRTLLIFGGSLGAERLNAAAQGLADLWRDREDLQILHISGSERAERIAATIAPGRLTYRVQGYVEAMVEAYAVADLCLCRGGATTVAELCVLGVPAIVVPYPHHRDRQQERHARVLETAGAAVMLLDAAATPGAVAELSEPLLASPERLERMAAAALRLGRPRAAEDLAEVVRGAAA